MTDITIKYDHGQMLIHLEEFLSCRSISKVRKLIKLINRSDNPDIVNQIKDHIQYRMEGLDNITMITENRIDRNKADLRSAEKEYKDSIRDKEFFSKLLSEVFS